MAPKKITVDGVGGVKLASEEGYHKWLVRQGVPSLLESENCQVDFESLVDGGEYTLGRPQQKQPDCIFSHGLPELGPLPGTTKLTSNPFLPTEDQHAAARLQISAFAALSDLEELPYPKTNIWNQLVGKTGTLGGYSSEEDANSHVKKVMVDTLESLARHSREGDNS